ncbi:uncharacterized protein LOC120424818 isoform X2 [Culex pipiens pallens]|nr:uncharacterized protein LOC120424818 isoform X2 [Culex pipiens pallens]
MRRSQGLRKTAVPSRKEVLRSIVDVSTATKPAGHVDSEQDEMYEVDGLVKEYRSRVSIAPNVPAGQVDSKQNDEMIEQYLAYAAVAANERADEVDLVEDEVNGEYLAYEQADQVDLEENEMDEEYLAYVPHMRQTSELNK